MCWRSKTPNKKNMFHSKDGTVKKRPIKAHVWKVSLKKDTRDNQIANYMRSTWKSSTPSYSLLAQKLPGRNPGEIISWGAPWGHPTKTYPWLCFCFCFQLWVLRLFSFVNLCKFFFCHFFYGFYMVNHHHWATTIRNMFLFFPTTIKLWEIHQNHSRWNTLKIYTIFSKEDPQKEAAP